MNPAALAAATAAVHLLAPPHALAQAVGGAGRAQLLWSYLRNGDDPLANPDALGAGLKRAAATLEQLTSTVELNTASACGTRKLLLRLQDGHAVESVIIPSAHFSTLCVSSQVGCKRACAFCATGAMGLQRSLETHEILAQCFAAIRAAKVARMPPIRNVVFMGQGEPLDNLVAVGESLEALTHPHAFGFHKKHVCVSTVGPSPQSIAALAPLPARLAWSVHAADDGLRKLLVPTTRHPMSELRDAFHNVLEQRGGASGSLLVETTLIDGINDDASAASDLIQLLAPLPGKLRINLIPYNVNVGLGPLGASFRPSHPEKIATFQRAVLSEGIICTVRKQRGDDSAAACGQLATRHVYGRGSVTPAKP